MTVCSRSGCTKTLRKDNSLGKCSSQCESPDAPAFQRAKGVAAADVARAPYGTKVEKVIVGTTNAPQPGAALLRLDSVATKMGLDPDVVIEKLAQSWLDGLRDALEG